MDAETIHDAIDLATFKGLPLTVSPDAYLLLKNFATESVLGLPPWWMPALGIPVVINYALAGVVFKVGEHLIVAEQRPPLWDLQ